MKISKILIVSLIIGVILSAGVTIFLSALGAFGSGAFDTITKGMLSKEAETLVFFLVIGFLCFMACNLLCLPIYIIKFLLVSKEVINKKYIDTKESVYTRDLPKYNSAVAGKIIDFKTTFEEEYLAGIIELISKGYIIENEESLIVDETKNTEGLLRNEKYILKTCTNINSNLQLNRNYEFYKELKKDMYDLGLYKKGQILNALKNKIAYYIKTQKKDSKDTLKFFIISILVLSLFSMMMGNFILMIMLYLIIVVLLRKNKLTPEGELEKEKMGKLKLFLEKEIEFQDKGEEEIKLWERYSAFAVAFGLNTKMAENMKSKIIKEKDKMKI